MPAGIRQLLDLLGLPAFVEGRYFDVLAANDLACALSPNLQAGQKRLRAVLLDPAEQAPYPDWEQATARLVAGFHESVGTDADDPRFVQLVGELSLSSERFRRLWARHDVQARESMPSRIHHPQVGELTSAAKGSPSAVLRVSCSSSTTRNLARAAPKSSAYSRRWPARRPGTRYGRPRRGYQGPPTLPRP